MPDNPQPARYRQRPNEVDAIQWTGSNADALRVFAGIDFATIDPEDRVEDLGCDAQLLVEASHWVGIKPGDWVLKFEGYFIAKADVPFRAVWEPAVVPSAPADRAARSERYAQAIRGAGDTAYGNTPFYEAITNAVIAIADTEQAGQVADRAAILREAEAKAREVVAKLWGGGITQTELDRTAGARTVEWEIGQLAAQAELRRMADEAQQPETQAADCPHCPDGHTPPTGGSQPWSAWVASGRDGDGQPMQITVARSAGAHVAESDAQWMRDVLNGRTEATAPDLPLDHPLRRECRCSEAGVCRRCSERTSVATPPAAVSQPGREA